MADLPAFNFDVVGLLSAWYVWLGGPIGTLVGGYFAFEVIREGAAWSRSVGD